MNKYFLTFQSPELEAMYQETQTSKMKRPIYIFMISSLLIMNLLTLCYHFLSAPIQAWQMNLGFVVFCAVQILLIVIMNRMRYFQFAITLTNIYICFLEMNVNEVTKTKIEFFAYGNTFMQFQSVLYLISDFPYAVIQIVSHLIVRLVITIVSAKQTDYILVTNGFFTMVLLSISIFAKDKHERSTFIANLNDDHYDSISPFIINQPYFRVRLNITKLFFEVANQYLISRFPGYNSEYCLGCNARQLLRSYIYGNLTLEQSLLNKNLTLPAILQLVNHKLKFKVRVIELGISRSSFLIILEENQMRQEQIENIDFETNRLKITLKQHNKCPSQKYYNFGVQSVLLLQQKVLKKLNMQKLLNKLIVLYSINDKIDIQASDQSTTLLTFSYQLKIFLIQLIHITLSLEMPPNDKIHISFQKYSNHLDMIFRLRKGLKFIRIFESNYFLRETQGLLVEKLFSTNNMIIFSFKHYPSGSFYNSKENN